MKKLLIFVISLFLIIYSAGCTDSENAYDSVGEGSKNSEITEQNNQNIEKISTKFLNATNFVNGKAIVRTEQGVYCINKEGSLIKKLDDIKNFAPDIFNGKNFRGFAANSEMVYCNTDGKSVSETQLSADKIYEYAYADGYLIVRVNESSFDSTSIKIGVLNGDFEWVVPPSVDVYKSLFDKYGRFCLDNNGANKIYAKGYLYLEELGGFFNLETGKIISKIDSNTSVFFWLGTHDVQGNKVFEAYTKYDTMSGFKWVTEDKAYVTFNNSSAAKSFFSIMDKSGNLLFDPIEYEIISFSDFDKNYFMIQENTSPTVLNYSGKVISTIKTEVSTRGIVRYSLSDGVVRVQISEGVDGKTVITYKYFNVNGQPLF